jgi:hypothetical protein
MGKLIEKYQGNPMYLKDNEVKKTFNITPAVPGSGYTDTAINHDQILANTLLIIKV